MCQMQETCTLRMYLSSNLPTSTIPYKGLPKIHMLEMRWNTFIPTCHIFKQNEANLKTVINKLERKLGDNKDDAIKSGGIYINNSMAVLKETSTVKSASRKVFWPIEVLINTEEERNRILSNLRNLKDIPEYKTISVTKDYTISERRMIKDWSDKAK